MNDENIYLVLKCFENSLISLTNDSDKPKTIGRDDFIETINYLEKRDFIKETDLMNQFKITDIGSEKLQELDSEKEKNKSIDNLIIKKRVQESIIRDKTIEKFRYDKCAFWLSIISIIISLFLLLAR